LIVGLLILYPLAVLGSIAQSAESITPPTLGASTLVLAVLAGGSVFSGVALLKRWPEAPFITGSFLVCAFGVLLADLILSWNRTVNRDYALGEFSGRSLWPIVWCVYLRVSKRVQNTYRDVDVAIVRRWPAYVAAGGVLSIALLLSVSSATKVQELDEIARNLGPYDLVKHARLLGSAGFDKGFAQSQLNRLQRALPQGKIHTRNDRVHRFEQCYSEHDTVHGHYDIA